MVCVSVVPRGRERGGGGSIQNIRIQVSKQSNELQISSAAHSQPVAPKPCPDRGTPGNSWWGCAARFFKS